MGSTGVTCGSSSFHVGVVAEMRPRWAESGGLSRTEWGKPALARCRSPGRRDRSRGRRTERDLIVISSAENGRRRVAARRQRDPSVCAARPTCRFSRCGKEGAATELPPELELLDPITDLVPIEPEQRGDPGLVPAGSLQGLHDQVTLDGLDTAGSVKPVDNPSFGRSIGKSLSVSRLPSLSSTARSTAFRNSRTLPGHG